MYNIYILFKKLDFCDTKKAMQFVKRGLKSLSRSYAVIVFLGYAAAAIDQQIE